MDIFREWKISIFFVISKIYLIEDRLLAQTNTDFKNQYILNYL